MNLVHRLLHVRIGVAAALFAFWVVQLASWGAMMLYVQFVNPRLGNSVLYVTQISHWALVESAGVGAISSWTLLHAKQIHRVAQEQSSGG